MQASRKTTQLQGWGIAILRVLTGYLFLAAGVHRLFYDFYEEDLSQADLGPLGSLLNGPIVVAGSLGELVFGAALIVGLLTRWVSIPLAILMLADILVVHTPNELFEADPKYESALLRLGACITLALSGSGKVALDNILAIRRGSK
jgi:putative oxidoreductase